MKVTIEEAIKIVDPATRRDALFLYDPEERKQVLDEACHLVAAAYRRQPERKDEHP